MLLRAASLWQEKSAELNEIDARFGDGDHGLSMDRIAKLVKGRVKAWEENETFGDFLDGLGHGVMNIGGGSAGPLYGALICGLAEPLSDEDDLDGPKLKEMLAGALGELKGVSRAREGDKTLMDAVIPAVEAAQAAGTRPADILAAAAKAARAGAEDSRRHVAKFGRAKNCGEKSLGCPDPGALSAALFFRGLAEGFKCN
jgi:dihydroxyacetone kinase-like protein